MKANGQTDVRRLGGTVPVDLKMCEKTVADLVIEPRRDNRQPQSNGRRELHHRRLYHFRHNARKLILHSPICILCHTTAWAHGGACEDLSRRRQVRRTRSVPRASDTQRRVPHAPPPATSNADIYIYIFDVPQLPLRSYIAPPRVSAYYGVVPSTALGRGGSTLLTAGDGAMLFGFGARFGWRQING